MYIRICLQCASIGLILANTVAIANESELRSAWNERQVQYPRLIIRWHSRYEVNLAQEVNSPFGSKQDYGSGIAKFESNNETYWIRGDDAKVKISQMTRSNGKYRPYQEEMNFVNGEAKLKVDDLAQGWIRPDQLRPMCHHHAYMALQLCYRPRTSEFVENVTAGRINYVSAAGSWSGQKAHVYAVGIKPEHGKLEYYFDTEGYYLGFLSKNAAGHSTLEVRLTGESGRKRVESAEYVDLAPDGTLKNKHTFDNFQYEFNATPSDAELEIEFPDGYLIGTPNKEDPKDLGNKSHIVVNGVIEQLNTENRDKLDRRVSRGED